MSRLRPAVVRQVSGGVPALLLVALLIGGCGSSHAAQSTGVDRSPSSYEQCLADHGVHPETEPPSPAIEDHRDPNAVAAFEAARKACAADRPIGGLHPGGLRESTRHSFRKCMRRHGVPLPQPTDEATATPVVTPLVTPEASAERGGMLAGLDRNDPVVMNALEACRGLLRSAVTAEPTASATPTESPTGHAD
jgi:hypothetical protein